MVTSQYSRLKESTTITTTITFRLHHRPPHPYHFYLSSCAHCWPCIHVLWSSSRTLVWNYDTQRESFWSFYYKKYDGFTQVYMRSDWAAAKITERSNELNCSGLVTFALLCLRLIHVNSAYFWKTEAQMSKQINVTRLFLEHTALVMCFFFLTHRGGVNTHRPSRKDKWKNSKEVSLDILQTLNTSTPWWITGSE